MKIKQQFILFFIIMLFISFCGCASKKQKPDPGTPDPELSSKPLEFFGCSFHDEEGFTFDGFPLMTDYKIMKERMKLTRTEIEPYVEEDYEGVYGKEQHIYYVQVSLEDYPEALGNITYNFYKEQFAGGSMTITFPDYESAVQYAKEKAGILWSLQEEGLEEKLEEKREKREYKGRGIGESEQAYTYSATSLDKRNIYVQITTAINAYQKGVVKIFFLENTPINEPGALKGSIYFDVEEEE